MNKTGAWLVCYALEQLGVKHIFGIPGVHNMEIYDALNNSEHITPHLVTHEMGAAFMADAVSRTSDQVGTLIITPGAGITHAASGIAEAAQAGIPLLIICGSINTESNLHYQFNDADHSPFLKTLTKATFKVTEHSNVVPMLFSAYDIATGLVDNSKPSPVFVEIPINLQLASGDVGNELPIYQASQASVEFLDEALTLAAKLLTEAERPGIFAGWGSVDAQEELIALAEYINAPVCTSLQGISAFPANHPLHTGMTFGPAATPAPEKAFADCDCLLAVGTRFSEIATGGFSAIPPETLIHIDIDHQVFNANFPAQVALCGDASAALSSLLPKIKDLQKEPSDFQETAANIASNKVAFFKDWHEHNSKKRVNPALFFDQLRKLLDNDAIVVTDSGNHAFLTAELMPIHGTRGFISPASFQAMGYCVPAVNGAKLVNPKKQVVGIVGDGTMLVTGMETVTASHLNLGTIYCLFNDGELSQIAQSQQTSYNRKTCSALKKVNWGAFAESVDCGYIPIDNNNEIETGLRRALETASHNQPVIVDVHIDYSRATHFSQGILKSNLSHVSRRDKLRLVGRALKRKLTG